MNLCVLFNNRAKTHAYTHRAEGFDSVCVLHSVCLLFRCWAHCDDEKAVRTDPSLLTLSMQRGVFTGGISRRNRCHSLQLFMANENVGLSRNVRSCGFKNFAVFMICLWIEWEGKASGLFLMNISLALREHWEWRL